MKTTINVGIVGAGYIADYHARGLVACDGVSVVAVANHRLAKANEFAQRYQIAQAYDSFSAMLEHAPLDAVVLAVPNVHHYPMAIEAMSKGIHVFVEKPMACSVEQAEAMCRLAESNGVVLMVGHMWRFDRETRFIREQVESGKLGTVFRTTSYGIHVNWGPGGWFTEPDLAWGGALADMGVHAIDTARYLIGDPNPVQVYASVQSNMNKTVLDDTAIVVVRWDNGVTSVIESGWWQPHMEGPEAATRLYGTLGFGSLFPTFLLNKEDSDERRVVPELPQRSEHCDQHMYSSQMNEFASAIRERRPAIPGGHEGLVNMQILVAAYESGRSGRAVDV